MNHHTAGSGPVDVIPCLTEPAPYLIRGFQTVSLDSGFRRNDDTPGKHTGMNAERLKWGEWFETVGSSDYPINAEGTSFRRTTSLIFAETLNPTEHFTEHAEQSWQARLGRFSESTRSWARARFR